MNEKVIIELKCKICGEIMEYRFNNKKDTFQKCPNCSNQIDMRTECKLDGILDIDKFDIIGIKHPFPESIFYDDLKQIRYMYEQSSDDEKKQILSILDNLYLLLHRKDDTTNAKIQATLQTMIREKNGWV